MTILVTGANGFVGEAVVARLTEKGHRVVPLRRPAEANELAADSDSDKICSAWNVT